jgi:mercuric ion binding protein
VTKLVSTALLGFSLLVSSVALASEQTVTLAVQNVYCSACPITVKSALQAGSRRRQGRRFLCGQDSGRDL